MKSAIILAMHSTEVRMGLRRIEGCQLWKEGFLNAEMKHVV